MASSLVNRAANLDRTTSFFKLSFSSLRNLSTSTTPSKTTPETPATVDGSKKPKKKKKKNLIEVAQFLPNWGIGYHMAKKHWANVSYEITKINLYKDGRHGKAWGLAHRDGLPIADAPKKISGVHKRCWKYIPNLKKAEESTPKKAEESTPKKAEESTPEPDLQAA